jgi:hypothetical protein
MSGDPGQVVGNYLSEGVEASGEWHRPDGDGSTADPDVVIRSVRVVSDKGEATPVVPFNRPFHVEISYHISRPLRDLVILCGVTSHQGLVWQSWDTDSTGQRGQSRGPGSYVSKCEVPGGLLRPGRYQLTACAQIPNVRIIDIHSQMLAFDVSEVGYQFALNRGGAITPLLQWEVVPNGNRPVEESSKKPNLE